MQILRAILYSFFLFLIFEVVALSAVSWSFYESVRNSLRQEAILSDHRARDLVLALAKASETRWHKAGIQELNKTFQRYQEQTGKDPEHFVINEIALVNTKGVILSHSNSSYTSEVVEKRKPSPVYEGQQFFRIALRMRKWEWSEPLLTPDLKKPFPPKMPVWASEVLALIPEANANQAKMISPVYHESKLDVLGLVCMTYTRGNLVLLFENQWKLCQWMVLNYSVIAFSATLFLSALFILFQYFAKSDGKSTEIETEPSFLEKKVYSDLPDSKLEPEKETMLNSNVSNRVSEEIQELPAVSPVPAITTPQSGRVMDAIYLG